jgi:hypothetical protein
VAEGQQAAIAEQKVEGRGEQREAKHVHQEDRVDDERADRHERHKSEEDQLVVRRHAER